MSLREVFICRVTHPHTTGQSDSLKHEKCPFCVPAHMGPLLASFIFLHL